MRPSAILALLLLVSPTLASGPVHCTTYEEKTMGRLQTLCDDGTRAVSTYNQILERWDTTLIPTSGKVCTGQLNARTRQMGVHCR